MRIWIHIIGLVALLYNAVGYAQPMDSQSVPQFGAQIFIEPGQTPEQIDDWFRTLAENGMRLSRIRMFESYMSCPDDSWDFTLFDNAFRSAEKYGVKIYATLFPATAKTDIGGWKFPQDNEQQRAFARYIEALVNHYKSSPALTGWVLLNEPGIGGHIPATPFMESARRHWDESHPACEYTEKGYPILMNTRDQLFLQDVTTDFLGWIASEVRKYDSTHDIHVNPAGIFSNYGDYDFAVWRTFLTSLGGSAHPSWHFNYFKRDEYTVAMLALAEMLRSGAGELPWFMTEIQGGNNIYSGGAALCPTPEETAQWLWSVIGCEGKGGIFWMLNPRSSGIEAGEWAMIDFQGRPSERLTAAKEVAETVAAHGKLFRQPKIVASGIDILYLKESLWAEQRMARNNDRYEGRRHGAVIKSPIAMFRALTERGLNAGLKEFSDYDFTKTDYTGCTIILSNQIALPSHAVEPLKHFVCCGGTLLVEGLTAFFDENLHNTMTTGFAFREIFGDEISEFILVDELFDTELSGRTLPTHLWRGSFAQERAALHRHDYGRGTVLWLPSNVALGAWVSGNYRPLSDWLFGLLPHNPEAVCFNSHHSLVAMRTLATEQGTLLICINKSGTNETVELNRHLKIKKIIYATPDTVMTGSSIGLPSEGILVALIQ